MGVTGTEEPVRSTLNINDGQRDLIETDFVDEKKTVFTFDPDGVRDHRGGEPDASGIMLQKDWMYASDNRHGKNESFLFIDMASLRLFLSIEKFNCVLNQTISRR